MKKVQILELFIKTNSIYDEAINEILRAYKINVPVRQLSGKMDASLKNFDKA